MTICLRTVNVRSAGGVPLVLNIWPSTTYLLDIKTIISIATPINISAKILLLQV